ncbi:hypothetical protein ZWY2020_036124 [Hordeum vulgare]|nr:hypothetical protein ZWY2020_011428 [Hordeum vulgare]KAI4988807.1 hypothetical protein ZWY2020_036124 [Hordeum vulgare]
MEYIPPETPAAATFDKCCCLLLLRPSLHPQLGRRAAPTTRSGGVRDLPTPRPAETAAKVSPVSPSPLPKVRPPSPRERARNLAIWMQRSALAPTRSDNWPAQKQFASPAGSNHKSLPGYSTQYTKSTARRSI